jgi:hypothetical protein
LKFHYSVRAVKDGEKEEGKFMKRYIYIKEQLSYLDLTSQQKIIWGKDV